MDIASFGIASVACITVICYLAATAVKQTPLANKWLPSICGALGGLLGLAAMYINVPDFPAAGTPRRDRAEISQRTSGCFQRVIPAFAGVDRCRGGNLLPEPGEPER